MVAVKVALAERVRLRVVIFDTAGVKVADAEMSCAFVNCFAIETVDASDADKERYDFLTMLTVDASDAESVRFSDEVRDSVGVAGALTARVR